MKLVAELALSITLVASTIVAHQPPKGLWWGMNKADAIDQIAISQGLKMKDKHHKKPVKWCREYPEFALPQGYFRAEIKGAKLFKKKAEKTYAVFNEKDQLTSFQYVMQWSNSTDEKNKSKNKGMRKSWVFHSDLKGSIMKKYGAPTVDEAHELTRATAMPSGTKYTTSWIDKDGSAITLIITRQTHNAIIAEIDMYLVFLLYNRLLDNVMRAPGGNDLDSDDDI